MDNYHKNVVIGFGRLQVQAGQQQQQQAKRKNDEQGRHCIYSRFGRFGAVDDSGVGALLRRDGQEEECAWHDSAKLDSHFSHLR